MRVSSFIALIFLSVNGFSQKSQFVYTKGTHFYQGHQRQDFLGINYWYGGFIGTDSSQGGRKRLIEELNFLKERQITNLRVFICAEGDSSYPYRIYPSLQEKPRLYNTELLKGFDLLLVEARKRDMKIVFVLNNNWEWSGGFGQYLEWAGYPNPILPKTNNWNWDKYCDYIAQFYTCDSCIQWNKEWIHKIITRKNSITGQKYANDPTIMAWELANEPRPMRKSAANDYKAWVKNTSSYIKSLDKNHLVTIGVEGKISTFLDSSFFIEIHRYPTIDYATIHLWPKTWQWYNGEPAHSIADTTLEKTKNYIQSHLLWTKKINKPLVIEEFGLHRDDNGFDSISSTFKREAYTECILNASEDVAGYNIWGGIAHKDGRLKGDFWKRGLPYSADPPQEEQGLYGLYMTDSIWTRLETFSTILQMTNALSK